MTSNAFFGVGGVSRIGRWILMGALLTATTTHAVMINEFMAANTKTASDPQGDFDDWIELYNPAAAAVDVGGWYLTDDLSEPRQWRLPSGHPEQTTIPAGGYLVVWADRDTAAPGLHAGFALSSGGEQIGLYAEDGQTLIDVVLFGSQIADLSWGRFPDGTESWQTLSAPSPGAANETVYEGTVAPVAFSVTRGFYDAALSVELTCETPGAEILFTVDGSDPLGKTQDAPAGGRGGGRTDGGGTVYGGPITVQRTTCLRAVARKDQWRHSTVATHTYLFLEDIKRQSSAGQSPGSGWPQGVLNGQVMNYGMDPDVVNNPAYADLMDDALTSLPTISLVTDLANLFDEREGIYVHAQSQGRYWERPVSVELIYPDGTPGFQIDAGLRIRGGFSRQGSNPKHAFRLLFRAEYGAAKLRYPLFGDEGADTFESVDLRTSQNYSWSFQGNSRNTMVREVFSRDVQGQMGQPYTRSRYYHLYLNGQYWGLFQTQERAEASFAATYLGGQEDDYDVIKTETSAGRTMVATDGNMKLYRKLYDLAILGFSDPVRYLRAQGLDPNGQPDPSLPKLLDVDNLIDFMLIDYFTGDRDGPGSRYGNRPNNTFLVINRVNPDGFKWFQHDSEHTLGTGEYNLVQPFTTAGAQWSYFNPHWLHERLARTCEPYRRRFADRAQRHLGPGGLLSPEANQARIRARAQQIELAMIAESARWGDSRRNPPLTQADWRREVDWILDSYLPTRSAILLEQLQAVDWYPDVEAPVLSVDGQDRNRGYVSGGSLLSLTSASPDATVYYTVDGSDPRAGTLPTTTQTTILDFNAPKRVLIPTGPVDAAWQGAQPFDDAAWTAGEGHVGFDLAWAADFTFGVDLMTTMWAQSASCYVRIGFDLPETAPAYRSLRLLVWFDDGFVAYLNGVRVAAANAPDQPTWQDRASQAHEPGEEPVVFDITAYRSALRPGHNVLALHGLNSSPTSPDFLISAALEGANTELGSVQEYLSPIPLDRSLRVSACARRNDEWSALAEGLFVVEDLNAIRLTEIMYHPVETPAEAADAEYVELCNTGAEPVNLQLCRFTNGIDFTFPDTVLAPGACALVVADRAVFEAVYGAGLPVIGEYAGRLNNGGERLRLADPLDRSLADLRYSDGSHPDDATGAADPWPTAADGLGSALGLVDASRDSGDPAAWGAVAPSPGSP